MIKRLITKYRMSRPLDGIRVLELGNLLAGPFCGMLLGDMGADVIKIETPQGGDLTRHTQPYIAGESANFIAINRNKRSVAINLKAAEGRDIVRELARGADLVLENFRPGVMAKLGLGVDDLRAVNPAIVYVSVSGFGQTGPNADRAAVNLVIEAASGSLSVSGEPDQIPMRPGIQTGDMFGALFATYAALSGLMGRVRHNRGRAIDVSLVEASISAAVWETSEYLATGTIPKRLGHRHRLTAPYQVFQGNDGMIVIGCPSDHIFHNILRILDCSQHATDPRFASYSLRKANENALLEIIEGAVARRSVSDLETALVAAGVPCSRVNDYRDIFDDPHLRSRAIAIDATHPRAGDVKMVRNPILFDTDGPAISRVAPLLGEHTAEVLSELGFSVQKIRQFEDNDVVRTLRGPGPQSSSLSAATST
jgi:crotonobetainyl-CoA:carnitine CoA-transferase CaiB-like acyl-CoA transferase